MPLLNHIATPLLLQMKELHIITPVKDSIDSTLQTIRAVLDSHIDVPFTYTVYNDFSTAENTARLAQASQEMGFRLVNLSDLTSHPSPNYLLVLQTAQREALAADAALCIVESDVVVQPHTLQSLYDGALQRADCGIAASVTVDDEGNINYPYLYARGKENQVINVKKHCSFCPRSWLTIVLHSSTPRRIGLTLPSHTSRSIMVSTIISSPHCPLSIVRTKVVRGRCLSTKIH